MRILILEDDVDLAGLLATGLRAESYAVDVATTLDGATELLIANPYDIACIDLGLPDGDGLALVRELALGEGDLERPERIIITTSRDAVEARVAGLDAGADDYLVKPFAFAELTARVRALGRRDRRPGNLVTVGDLEVDLAAHSVHRRGARVELTAREFAVLRFLAQRPEGWCRSRSCTITCGTPTRTRSRGRRG